MAEAQRIDTGFAEVSGAPLYYEIAGAGRPLVLIHEDIAYSHGKSRSTG
jgi:hypothetical protein